MTIKRLGTIALLLFLGIVFGISGTLHFKQNLAEQNKPAYQVVVQPTRKTTLSYTENSTPTIAPFPHFKITFNKDEIKSASYSYANPQKKLCVIVYNRRENFFAIYQLKNP